MMNGRPGQEPLKFLPDEARSLPPPKLTDPRLVYIGFLGYCTGLLDNMMRMRPVMKAGEGCEEVPPGGGAAGEPAELSLRDPCFSGPSCLAGSAWLAQVVHPL